MTQEIACVRSRVGSGVENFVGCDTGRGRSSYVAYCVAAGFAGAQTYIAEYAHDFRSVVQENVMELDVLTGSEVALLQWCVFRGDFTEYVQLVRSKPAEWCLDSHHLLVNLALAVHALLQAVRHELGFFPFTVSESRYFTFEILDFTGANFENALSVGVWSPSRLLSLSSQLMLPGPA
jgi:hypothetical protein